MTDLYGKEIIAGQLVHYAVGNDIITAVVTNVSNHSGNPVLYAIYPYYWKLYCFSQRDTRMIIIEGEERIQEAFKMVLRQMKKSRPWYAKRIFKILKEYGYGDYIKT